VAEHGKRKNPEIAPNKNCKNGGEEMIVTGNRKEVKKIGCKIIRDGVRTQLQFYFFACVSVFVCRWQLCVCACVCGSRVWSTDNFFAFPHCSDEHFPNVFFAKFPVRSAANLLNHEMFVYVSWPKDRSWQAVSWRWGWVLGEFSGPDRRRLP